MIDAALPYLRCPVCEQPLARAGRALRCPAGHSFDLAKQGYANLTAGRVPYPGDTAEMIADRDSFLTAGHYDFIADALAGQGANGPAGDEGDALAGHGADALAGGDKRPGHGDAPAAHEGDELAGHGDDGLVLDAGTGTGYYLARVLAGGERIGLGIDVSKAALRRAARAHPRAAAVLADLWGPLPVRDGMAAVILDVFAPRNGPEFHRVLRPDGVLLVVTPAPDHLAELIEAYGLIRVDPDKAARVAESLDAHFTAVRSQQLRRELTLTAAEVRTLVGMTPSAHHVPAAGLPAGPCTVTAAVTLTAYRKRGEA
jgi:23S rRNA (guanine745-N1)-methyltransferase